MLLENIVEYVIYRERKSNCSQCNECIFDKTRTAFAIDKVGNNSDNKDSDSYDPPIIGVEGNDKQNGCSCTHGQIQTGKSFPIKRKKKPNK